MVVTTSRFRQNIYKLLDGVLESGIPLVVTRKGRTLKVMPDGKRSKLLNLKARKTLKCDPDSIIHMDWSKEWRH